MAGEEVNIDTTTWNQSIAALPGCHILQTWEWGQIKARYGWEMMPRLWHDEHHTLKAAAMVLQRTIPIAGLAMRPRILYIPRGPLLDWNDSLWRKRVLDDVELLARQQRAILVKIDPEVVIGEGVPGTTDAMENETGSALAAELKQRGWRFSNDQVQFRNTVWIDLRRSEEELLACMKQKTRYNLRLAQKKGVVVRSGSMEDLPVLYRMYAYTSIRDGFVIRPEEYYLAIWSAFMQRGMAKALVAEVDNTPVAGLLLFFFAGKSWYLYGMSLDEHREKMPNYLLQWEAMRHARAAGCRQYDLWGAPDIFDASDALWGVYRFKEGLGGKTVRLLGAWDYAPQEWLYQLYMKILPRLLTLMRLRGKAQTRSSLESH